MNNLLITINEVYNWRSKTKLNRRIEILMILQVINISETSLYDVQQGSGMID